MDIFRHLDLSGQFTWLSNGVYTPIPRLIIRFPVQNCHNMTVCPILGMAIGFTTFYPPIIGAKPMNEPMKGPQRLSNIAIITSQILWDYIYIISIKYGIKHIPLCESHISRKKITSIFNLPSVQCLRKKWSIIIPWSQCVRSLTMAIPGYRMVLPLAKPR